MLLLPTLDPKSVWWLWGPWQIVFLQVSNTRNGDKLVLGKAQRFSRKEKDPESAPRGKVPKERMHVRRRGSYRQRVSF